MAPFHLEHLRSIPTFLMGVGAIFWIPISMAIGRRPVLLICGIISVLSIGFAGLSGNFYSLLAALAIQGFAYGVTLSTVSSLPLHAIKMTWLWLLIRRFPQMVLMVIDITFIHERPQAIAIWFCVVGAVTFAVLSFIPLVFDLSTIWKPFYFAWSFPSLVSTLLVFLVVPETYFLRPPVAFDGRVLVQSGSERFESTTLGMLCPAARLIPSFRRRAS
jgi:MFS family permease